MSNDILDRLAAYRPTSQSLDSEWSATRRADAVGEILDPVDDVSATVRFAPRPARRWRALAPVAASVAVFAVVGGAVAWDHSRSGDTQPGSRPSASAPTVSPNEDRVGPGQYSVRQVALYLGRGGHALRRDGHDTIAAAPDGDIWTSYSDGSPCTEFDISGTVNLGNPDQAFFDSLPTDPVALEKYMRSHVSGSTSVDEAVFVAVGDALRNDDGLASNELRTAFVEVLTRTGHVTVHDNVRDQLGRRTTRADFVDPVRRPGQVSSLYFGPATDRLLEERDSGTGNGGKRIVNVVVTTSETTHDSLPQNLRHCTVNHDN